MNAVSALIAVLLLAGAGMAAAGVPALRTLLGAWLPYAAIAIFLGGLVWRVLAWAKVPVPFRIPTTSGQAASLPWIKQARLDCPSTAWGAAGRMLLEVLLFRSLFRNSQAELRPGPRLTFAEEKWLWLGAIVFHWCFLIVFLRHLRFFLEPVPACVTMLQTIDGFFQVGSPVLLWTGVGVLAALAYLIYRRFAIPQVRYISLFTDYFALFVLFGLCLTGVLMRYFIKVDIVAVKQLGIGLVTLTPVVPDSIGPIFFAHLLLLSVLLVYFPFSKLVHMPGVFLSPTRNLANNNRMERHVNPWNYPVKVHTYEEWEEEFHDKIVAAGLPLNKD